MFLNKTDIINAGLFTVGSKKIFAPTDNTKSARLANSIYDFALELVFDMGIDWHWATVRSDQLAQLSTDPTTGFDFQYALPDNVVRVIAMVDPATGMIRNRKEREFSFETGLFIEISGDTTLIRKVLRSNVEETEAFIKYIVFVRDVALYPGWFSQLVALTIAIYIAEPIKQHTPHYTKIKDMIATALTVAQEANAMTNVTTGNTTRQDIDLGNNDLVNAAGLGIDNSAVFFGIDGAGLF